MAFPDRDGLVRVEVVTSRSGVVIGCSSPVAGNSGDENDATASSSPAHTPCRVLEALQLLFLLAHPAALERKDAARPFWQRRWQKWWRGSARHAKQDVLRVGKVLYNN